MTRRITIAKLSPRVPGSVTYATLNPTDKAASVALSGSNLIATGSASNVSVRADIGLTLGSWYWETRSTNITGARPGIARSGASLTAALGGDLLSVGGPDSAGQYRVNGADFNTGFGTITTSDTIGHWFDAAAGTYSVRLNNGAWLLLLNVNIAGNPWYPVLQVGNGGVQLIRANPSSFAFTTPTGVRPGLYHEDDPTPTDYYVSSDPYVPDSPALLPRLSGAGSDLVIERHAKIWPFNSTGTDRRGRLFVLNGDRALDVWDIYGWINAEYEILVGNEGDDFGDFVTWSRGVIDSQGWDERRNIVIALAEPLARLDAPIQPTLYPEGGNNSAIVGKPLPITLGTVRLFPTLLSTLVSGGTEHTYQVNDGPVFDITTVWDRGDELVEGTDWNTSLDRTGFQLDNPPDNPVSALVSGAFEEISVAVPDAGVADDFEGSTWAGSPLAPPGWTNASTGGGTVVQVVGDPGGARFQSAGGGELARLSVLVTGGVYYFVQITVSSYTSGSLILEADNGAGEVVNLDATVAGTYTAVLFATFGLRIRNTTGEATDYMVSFFTAAEVELIDTLPHWLRYLCVTRGGFSLADVDVAAADTLETKTGYRLGWFGNQATSMLKLLRMAMDSFTGWVTTTRAGVVTVGRLESDGTEPIAFALDDTNIKTISERKDIGPNFTRMMAGARNYAVHTGGDLATSVTQEDQALFLTEWGAVREADAEQTSPDITPTGATLTDAPEANEAYASATGNAPQPTLLTDAVDVAAEINRVSSILDAGILRWWEVRALLATGIPDSIEIGQRVTITMPLDGLDSGVSATIMGATIWANSNDVVLNLLQYPEVT